MSWLFGFPGATSQGAAMQWRGDLVTLHALSDAVIALSFFIIPLGIVFYLRRRRGLLHEYRMVAWLFGGFILICGLTHLLGVVTLWYPVYGIEGLAKGVTAILAGAAVGLIWPLLPTLVQVPSSRELADINQRLRQEVEAHEVTLQQLATAHRELERRVDERTQELRFVNARFAAALRGAPIHLFCQDRDLRYTWAYSPDGDSDVLLGQTDHDLWSPVERDIVVKAKTAVMEERAPRNLEVSLVVPERRGMFALHMEPMLSEAGNVEGVMAVAIDISRIRSLETEQRRLSEELGAALQRYETALRGSQVRVYTQDLSLRYTALSGPMFGLQPDEFIGRHDDDVFGEESRVLTAAKQRVLSSGKPAHDEFRIRMADRLCWYDMHIEPLRDSSGTIIGLTSAAVDVSGRKANEAHLRDLMRELTHRSKNLLAVIQAMARQTARHTGDTEHFLEYFSARLQAMSASHDLLVQEGWHGASLSELVRSQLGHHLERESPQVVVRGPSLVLKPDAAQTIGLALHELATNAGKYGALSVPAGQVAIEWSQAAEPDGTVDLRWLESGGPSVSAPERNGFGRLVIERNLSRALDAQVSMDFDPAGLQCRIRIPADNLAFPPPPDLKRMQEPERPISR